MTRHEMMFSCSHCDAQFSKWSGRCQECGAWGTVLEISYLVRNGQEDAQPGTLKAFVELDDVHSSQKISLLLPYLDRLLGGGLVSGSVTLVGGEPGIGKSTLLSQLAIALGNAGQIVLYVTGEESPSQVVLRLRRLSASLPKALLFLDEVRAEVIAATIKEKKPLLTIVDSIQSLRVDDVGGEAGQPNQVRVSAALIAQAAKTSGSSVLLVGQVTKDGDLAGPKLLEHLVDTVCLFEGDRFHTHRLLRLVKHRFGSCDESVLLAMTERGLEEILDPSSVLLADRSDQIVGSVAGCFLAGARPLFVEVQALVTPTGYGMPTRRTSGLDGNRLSLILAVLSRHLGINFSDQDVFVNVVGGFEPRDPSLDAALALALLSAKKNHLLPRTLAAWGEIGLTGEIRSVARFEERLKEAMRLGFSRLLIPWNKDLSARSSHTDIMMCRTLKELAFF